MFTQVGECSPTTARWTAPHLQGLGVEVRVGSICGSHSVLPAFHPVSIEIKAAPDTNLKMFKKVVELVHEEVDCSKFFGDVFRLRGLADIDLVVKDDGDIEASVEFFEGEDVVMGETETVM